MGKQAQKTAISPPEHLKLPTKRWFSSVVDEFDLAEHHIKLLTLACDAWDRAVSAREAIATHGLTFEDRFGAPHSRPEIAIERDSRIGFARLIRELGLDLAGDPETPRTPKG